MQATTVLSSKFPFQPILPTSQCKKRRPIYTIVSASRGMDGCDDWGKLVDENMIVLRMRIKEMKMTEMNHEPPSDWMEWEKQYFTHYYNSDVCEAIGLLQNYLMNVRPSLALGMLALVAFSVPISTGVTLFHAIEIAKGILSWFHVA